MVQINSRRKLFPLQPVLKLSTVIKILIAWIILFLMGCYGAYAYFANISTTAHNNDSSSTKVNHDVPTTKIKSNYTNNLKQTHHSLQKDSSIMEDEGSSLVRFYLENLDGVEGNQGVLLIR